MNNKKHQQKKAKSSEQLCLFGLTEENQIVEHKRIEYPNKQPQEPKKTQEELGDLWFERGDFFTACWCYEECVRTEKIQDKINQCKKRMGTETWFNRIDFENEVIEHPFVETVSYTRKDGYKYAGGIKTV